MSAASLDKVYKIYKEGQIETVALRGASLEIEDGDCVAITGRSGSGKSSLLSIMGGLSLPSAGKVRVADTDLAGLSEGERARFRLERMGFIYQDGNLLPWLDAQENVALPLKLAGRSGAAQRAKELLGELGLGARLSHRPRDLSGGERQRVALAVALANDTAILLADEPTGELDAATAEGIVELLIGLNWKRGTSLVIVTHNAAVAGRARRLVSMEDGLTIEGDARHE